VKPILGKYSSSSTENIYLVVGVSTKEPANECHNELFYWLNPKDSLNGSRDNYNSLTKGDVITCCIRREEDGTYCKLWKNGKQFGIPQLIDKDKTIYPTIGLYSRGVVLEVKLGNANKGILMAINLPGNYSSAFIHYKITKYNIGQDSVPNNFFGIVEDISASDESGSFLRIQDRKLTMRETLSFMTIPSFLLNHRNLILLPLNVVFDSFQCYNHCKNGNMLWGFLTALFIFMPNMVTCLTTMCTKRSRKGIQEALQYLFFFHLILFKQ
jgi:hypothetical protein